MKNLKIKIYGKVQGVFFRVNTQKKARELGITGWVKNEPDGTVLIEGQRDEKTLKKFLKWCQEGSPHSQVKKIETEWQKVRDIYENFEIKY